MSAIWYRFRAEMRARMRSMLAIALLLGIGGGAVLAAAAGARRTDSAYPRLLDRAAAAHLIISRETGSGPGLSPEQALADPAVETVRSYRIYLMLAGPPERCDAGACVVGLARGPRLGGPIDEMKLVEGALPDQGDPTHAVLTVVGARRLGLEVGDTFPLRGVPFGEPFEAFAERAREANLTMRVVGLVATPGDFPPQIGDETVDLRLTRAFYERFPEASFGLSDVLAVRLANGEADVAPFLQRVFARFPDTVPSERVAQDRNVQRSFHLQALALWALAGIAGLTLLLLVAQAIARELFLGSDDNAVLATLGLTRRAVTLIAIARVAVIATTGAAIALVLAVAVSPLFPRGLPRIAEPDPGPAADLLVLGLGGLVFIVGLLLLAAWPASRLARARDGRASASGRAMPTAAGRMAARAGASPSVVTGTRMALEPGSGRTAVPIRTTLIAVTLGVAAVASALSFGASLDRLLSTPRLYGVTFDMAVGAETVDFEQRAGELLAMPEVDGIAWAFDVAVIAGGAPLTGVMMDTRDPALVPPVLEGRPPRPAEQLEAVLGVASARRLGVGVGDAFTFEIPDSGQRMRARVVGLGALPTFEDSTALSDGVWFSHAGVARAIGQRLPASKAFVDLAPGAEPDAAFRRMAEVLGVPVDEDLWRPETGTPADLVSFGNVRSLPQVLAWLVGAIAIGILAHAVHSAIRRRARDLAIMKTLGFTRAQARATVLSNVLVLTVVTAAVGVPLGVVAGRWLWGAFADAQGIVTEHALPWVLMAGALSVLTVAALVVAASAARAAGRTRPAAILRAE